MDEASTPDSCRGREGGYLLLEVLVASMLLLVALLAIMPLFTLAVRQNAMAKDLTVAGSLALDKAEEFARWNCDNIRRGTCCKEKNVSRPGGVCSDESFTVAGIVYKRSCKIRQNVPTAFYNATDDLNDDDMDTGSGELTDPSYPVQGVAWIEVTVTPSRSKHLNSRSVKPAVITLLRFCHPSGL